MRWPWSKSSKPVGPPWLRDLDPSKKWCGCPQPFSTRELDIPAPHHQHRLFSTDDGKYFLEEACHVTRRVRLTEYTPELHP